MADLTFGDAIDIGRSTTKTGPSHFIFKIESFSSLAKNNMEIYTSREFFAGGYKWRLILHPNGNKDKKIDDHISLYLKMMVDQDGCSLQHSEIDVYATFRFFLLDQTNDNYLVMEDTTEGGRRFHGLKLEWGLDQLISHKVFENPSNGYLVNDTCVFGVEVYIWREHVAVKGEYLSPTIDPVIFTHTWTIVNFSNLKVECQESFPFIVGGHEWKVKIYPEGYGSGAGRYISLYLALSDPTSLPPRTQILVEFTLRILDQSGNKHLAAKDKNWFNATTSVHGWSNYVLITTLYNPNIRYLWFNDCIVQAKVAVIAVAKPL